MVPGRTLRWSWHGRLGRRHFGLALYRLDEKPAFGDRWYFHVWTSKVDPP